MEKTEKMKIKTLPRKRLKMQINPPARIELGGDFRITSNLVAVILKVIGR